MKWLHVIIAWLGGFIVTAVLLVGLTAGAQELVFLYFILTHPRELAPNADAGLLELALAPIVLPIIVTLSPLAGIVAGFFLYSKMQSANPSVAPKNKEAAD